MPRSQYAAMGPARRNLRKSRRNDGREQSASALPDLGERRIAKPSLARASRPERISANSWQLPPVRLPEPGTRKRRADGVRKRRIRGVGALLGGVAFRNAGLEPTPRFEPRGAKRKGEGQSCRHPPAFDDPIRQPV